LTYPSIRINLSFGMYNIPLRIGEIIKEVASMLNVNDVKMTIAYRTDTSEGLIC